MKPACLVGVGEHLGVDVHDHLVAAGAGLALDALAQRGLGQRDQGVGAQLAAALSQGRRQGGR